jgi:hypothetical protein
VSLASLPIAVDRFRERLFVLMGCLYLEHDDGLRLHCLAYMLAVHSLLSLCPLLASPASLVCIIFTAEFWHTISFRLAPFCVWYQYLVSWFSCSIKPLLILKSALFYRLYNIIVFCVEIFPVSCAYYCHNHNYFSECLVQRSILHLLCITTILVVKS